MPGLIKPTTKVIQAAGTATTTTTGAIGASSTWTLPLAASYELFVNVTAVPGSGLLDLVMQTSPDGGTTWFSLPIRTAQISAIGQYVIRWQPGMGTGEAAAGAAGALTGGAQSVNSIHYPDYTRFYATIGGTSVTFSAFVAMYNLTMSVK